MLPNEMAEPEPPRRTYRKAPNIIPLRGLHGEKNFPHVIHTPPGQLFEPFLASSAFISTIEIY
jgi:hypothetical protein